MSYKIRPAEISDAEAISKFAQRTFYVTFAAHNTRENMDDYIRKTYSADIQRKELQDPKRHVMVAEDAGQIIGFVQVRTDAAKDGVTGKEPMELQRIYIDEKAKGTGLAKELMNCAIALAHEMRFDTLWLGVWEHNTRALAFYKKFGFEEVGSHDFYLGTDKQRDLILSKDITRI